MKNHIDGSKGTTPEIFLKWLPDESFFSICSRFSFLLGSINPATTLRFLFNNPRNNVAHDFPQNLDALKHGISSLLGDPESIIRNHTILPFFPPFQSTEHIYEAIYALRAPVLGSIKYQLGLLTGRFGAEHPLKACSACMQQDIDSHGVAYWHLTHQYPGLIICPTHDIRLQECTLNRQWSGRFQWVLPCAAHLTPQTPLPEKHVTHAIRLLSESILDLSSIGNSRTFDPQLVATVYRDRLREIGVNLRHPNTISSFVEYSTSLQQLHPLTSLPTTTQTAINYIYQLTRSPRGHLHPLKHLVFITWLFSSLSRFIKTYDLAYLYRDRESVDMPNKHDHNPILTPKNHPEAAVTRLPKPKVLKPPIRAELITFLKEGFPKQELCEKFHITVSTINKLLRSSPEVKLAWEAAFTNNRLTKNRACWTELITMNPTSSPKDIRAIKPGLYAWLYRNDRKWLNQENLRLPSGRSGNNSITNWKQRDTELERAITSLLEKSSDHRSSKICAKEIFIALPQLSSRLQKRDKYPRTRILLRKLNQDH